MVRQFVESYGAYAALVSFLLMILQSIAAPLPAFLLTFANAICWMVEGSYFIVVQRYGRGGSMLLYRKAVGALCSRETYKQNRFEAD